MTRSKNAKRKHIFIPNRLHCLACGMPRESAWSDYIGPVCVPITNDHARKAERDFARWQEEQKHAG